MDLLAIIAIILAYIIKGMCGFANTLVFSSIMSFTRNNINITPIDLIVGFPSNLFIVWKERKGISLKVCIPLSVLVIMGILPGTFLLKNGNTQLIKSLFGFVVMMIGVEMLLRDRKKSIRKSSKSALLLIGIISGFLCGLFGIGAILVAYISRTTENQNQFKSNLCIVFFVENIFRIIFYSVTGIINRNTIKSSLMLLPFMVIGLSIGMILSDKAGERIVKKAVILLLILMGISLIINNISGLLH